jgi:hypothetical protein
MTLLGWTGMDADISDIWNFRRRVIIKLNTSTTNDIKKAGIKTASREYFTVTMIVKFTAPAFKN